MVKAYLRYEQAGSFGVIASPNVPVSHLNNSSKAPLLAAAAADGVIIWNLRKGEALVTFGNRGTRKAGYITSLAASSDSTHLAAGYADGSIRIWHFPSNHSELLSAFEQEEPEPVVTFNGHRSAVSALAFRQHSRNELETKKKAIVVPSVLVSGSNDGDVILWSIDNSSGVFRLNAHNGAVTSISLFQFRDSSYIVSASKDGAVKVFNAESQHCVQAIVGHRAEVWAMQLDPDISLLVTGSVDADLRVFLLAPSESSSAGNTQGGGSDHLNDLLLYDKENIFKSLGAVKRHVAAERVSTLAFTRHGGQSFLSVCAADKTCEVFRLRSRKDADAHRKRREKRGEANIVKEVRDTAEHEHWDAEKVEKTIAKRSADMNIELNAVDFLVSLRNLRMSKKLRSVSFVPEECHIPVQSQSGLNLQLLVQPRDNALEIHNIHVKGAHSKKRKREQVEEGDEVSTSAASEITKLVTLDFAGHRGDVRAVAISPDDTTLLTTSNGSMKLWNVASRKCIRTMRFSGHGLCTQYIGPDGLLGAVGLKEGGLRAYDLGSGTVVADVPGAHNGDITTLCLDDHIYEAGSLVTGGSDKRVCFWNFEDILVGRDGKLELTRVLEMSDAVLSVKVAYGRQRPVLLVSTTDSTVKAYFLDTLDPYLSFYGHQLPVMSMDVSTDGMLLVTGSSDKTVKLWGMDFGDCRKNLRGHSDSVLSVKFQPKTHYFFSGSRDGCLNYWDGDKFELIAEIEGQRGEVWALATNEDGEVMASSSGDKMIRVWRRTDEPIFLDEERDKRMDDMFESQLIEDDIKTGTVEKRAEGFMKDLTKGDSSAPGKRSIDTVKGGERLLEGLKLCLDEERRAVEEPEEAPNPLLLGLLPNAYILRVLEQIKTPDLEESLHILPLDAATQLLRYLARLLALKEKSTRLSVEMLTRSALYLLKLHQKQISSGAADRQLVTQLYEAMQVQLDRIRCRFGVNSAALLFWQAELAERDDAPFRDASARAYNLQRKKGKKAKSFLQASTQ